MTHIEIIELRAAEALAEIRKLAAQAQAEIKFRAAFWNRSQGQQRRFARLKGKK